MILNNNKQRAKRGALLALVLALMIPFSVFAETATATTASATASANTTTAAQTPDFGDNSHMRGGNSFLDTSSLTDEQKATYNKALTLYEQVEDAVLADLVTAKVVSQANVDQYTALRTAEKSVSDIDQSNWTAAQYKAYYEANEKTGDERTAAFKALVDAGQLNQAQADALSADKQTDLWASISQNSSTNSDIQTAMNTMRQARQTLNSTLREAGISSMMQGEQPRGLGNNAESGMPRQSGFSNQMPNQNNPGNGQQNGMMPNDNGNNP